VQYEHSFPGHAFEVGEYMIYASLSCCFNQSDSSDSTSLPRMQENAVEPESDSKDGAENNAWLDFMPKMPEVSSSIFYVAQMQRKYNAGLS